MNITDTSGAMPEAFDSGRFQIEKWKTYADAAVPGLKEICLEDLRETMNAGYSTRTGRDGSNGVTTM